ncbi:IS1595 family transposase [Acetobacteraceae bacterium KSS8]|uniref:IS1595 family transposase n=1 Tax=Endosaccharibacter trunci TaxID=2812733 RepID=A0ABT1W869_9PROT|nr:IS1595 family transposase [Acetobacteraceae bacterium KSS8]
MKVRRRSRLPATIRNGLLEHLVVGTPARTAADPVGVDRTTAPCSIASCARSALKKPPTTPSWSARSISAVPARAGEDAAGKVAVFGRLKRQGRVHAIMIPDAGSSTLLPIIRERVQTQSIVYSDSWQAYNKLDISKLHHRRINHTERFVEARNPINGIENFRSQARRHLRQYNGIPRQHFPLFLAECVWRLNERSLAARMRILAKRANIPLGSALVEMGPSASETLSLP